MASASVGLLLESSRDNPGWSNSTYTSPRSGNTIRHGDATEVQKALLMAGADRNVDNPRGADITDWGEGGHLTTNGLDDRFGAGQVNIHNSYQILAATEQDSQQDGRSADVAARGWDYDPTFGGSNASNAVADYDFTASADAGDTLLASLVWNLDIETGADSGGSLTFNEILYDLDLKLLEVDGGETLVAESNSTDETTENLTFRQLNPGTDYTLRVTPGADQSDFEWDYGLAWQTVPEPGSLVLLGLGAPLLLRRRPKLGAG
jgi:hypothetical protein